MSEMTLFKGGLPAYLKGEMDDATSALAGGELGARRISIKGGVFREFIGGKEYRVSEERAMNVIIIKAAPSISRVYYAGTYSEGATIAPACWSSDNQRPAKEVTNRQAETCLNCPQNIKGSGANESRACKYQQRVAVLLEGETEKREVYQLVLPSTSIFGDGEKGKLPLQAYARHLKSNGTPITGVITEMRFDTASPTPKLTFKPIRVVTEEEFEVVKEMKDSQAAISAITLTVAQTDGVVEEKPKAPVAKKVEVAPQEDTEIEEPKKAVAKKPPVKAEPELADLVGEWDDA